MNRGSIIYNITDYDHISAQQDVQSIVSLVSAVLDDRKAVDITAMDIHKKSDFADYMIVASGTSNRHVASLAQHVVASLKAAGLTPNTEGMTSCDWVLVDAGNVIIHLFHPEARAYYRIEKMWGVPAMDEIEHPELTSA